MNGILLVNKPLGWTSFDVVGKVRSLITKSSLNETGKKRFPVGHTGTLDPLATGLLILLLGTYTKKATDMMKLDKAYDVTMKLGMTSTTGDEEGTKTVVNEQKPTDLEVRRALEHYVGDIMQTPPIYSAIKIGGQRAYKLAREGREVKLEPRKASIYKIIFTDYQYPLVRFTAEVSSGTYIRSLVEDIGKELGTGAYMSALQRTKVGQFNIVDAIGMDNLSVDTIQASIKY